MKNITLVFLVLIIMGMGWFILNQQKEPNTTNQPNTTSQTQATEISSDVENLQKMFFSIINSDGFSNGLKITGTGETTEIQTKSILKNSSYRSKYFNREVPYSVMKNTYQGSTAAGQSVSIIQPTLKNMTAELSFESNQVSDWNPWAAGSNITGGLNAVEYNLINDNELVVRFQLIKEVLFPNKPTVCIKPMTYQAIYKLDYKNKTYIQTETKDRLLETECTEQPRG